MNMKVCLCVMHQFYTCSEVLICLQLYYREPWTLLPLGLPVIIGVLWAGALYFFLRNVSSWQVRNICLLAVLLWRGVNCLYMYMITQTLRKRERQTKQHNTTQHNLRQLFPRKKLHSGGTRTHASCILGVKLYQLSYWGSLAGWVRYHLYK